MLIANGSPSMRATDCTPGTFRRLGRCSVSYTSLNSSSLSGSTSMLATNRYLDMIGIECFLTAVCVTQCPRWGGAASPMTLLYDPRCSAAQSLGNTLILQAPA